MHQIWEGKMIIKTQSQSPLLVFNSNKSKETKNAWFTKRLRFLRKIFTKKNYQPLVFQMCVVIKTGNWIMVNGKRFRFGIISQGTNFNMKKKTEKM